jgi:carbon storage regulator
MSPGRCSHQQGSTASGLGPRQEEKGDKSNLPERPEACFAQIELIPFFSVTVGRFGSSAATTLPTGTPGNWHVPARAGKPIADCRQPDEWNMLVLSRQRDESIIIGDNVVITIVDVRGDKVRLGIDAPREVPVHRREVYEAIQRENQEAARILAEDARRVPDSSCDAK